MAKEAILVASRNNATLRTSGFTQMIISRRCPLCWAPTTLGVIKHLKVDHHRTEIEALALLERNAQGTLGWDPELKKKRAALRTWRIGN
jgi:hypothetical protein